MYANMTLELRDFHEIWSKMTKVVKLTDVGSKVANAEIKKADVRHFRTHRSISTFDVAHFRLKTGYTTPRKVKFR